MPKTVSYSDYLKLVKRIDSLGSRQNAKNLKLSEKVDNLDKRIIEKRAKTYTGLSKQISDLSVSSTY